MWSGAGSSGGTVGGNPIAPAHMDALRCSCPIPPTLPDLEVLN